METSNSYYIIALISGIVLGTLAIIFGYKFLRYKNLAVKRKRVVILYCIGTVIWIVKILGDILTDSCIKESISNEIYPFCILTLIFLLAYSSPEIHRKDEKKLEKSLKE